MSAGDRVFDALLRAIVPARRVYYRLFDLLPRPLDPVRSIKTKLGLLVVGSSATGMTYFWLMIGRIPPVTTVVAISLSLFTTLILAHGTTLPLREMTAAARAMARGDYTTRVRASARDEVGELAQAFNQMAADLSAADQHRRELIANVSHELRTPITALQAVLENIVDGVAEPDPTTMRTALAQTERLGRLISELLDLSRLDAGANTLPSTTFEASPFIDEVIAEARVLAIGGGANVRFRSTVDSSASVVTGDRDRLKQVLLNLVDNAARHSPSGGLVEISATRSGGELVLDVRDQGRGIPPEERDLVFERFTRGERATGGGTGLGLAIARWIVRLHGGTISVVDVPVPAGVPAPVPPGCLIRVTLPERQAPPELNVPTHPALTGANHV
jgi:signal transduction histidine kinase